MLSEERRAKLLQASQAVRVQDAQIQSHLDNMSDEEINNFVEQNPEVEEMLSIGADQDNPRIVVDYDNQPNKQQEISIAPPWEGILSTTAQAAQQGKVNLFQLGNPSNCISFGNNNYGGYVGNQQQDERIKRYTPGMRLYGINPYNFYNAEAMENYYQSLEEDREYQCNQQYGWALFIAQHNPSKEMIDWAESFKFKSAEQILKEQEEAKIEAERERMEALKEMEGDGSDIIYNVYDINGIRYQRAISFKIIDCETGSVIREKNYKTKDNRGQSYTIHTRMEDRQKQYEMEQFQNEVALFEKRMQITDALMKKAYFDNINRWNAWKAEGLSLAEQYARREDERIDWKKQEQLIERALRTAAFSKDSFNKILSACCNTDLTYDHRSNFFSLSYDFERDLHYKALTSTPEEMSTDPLVHQKLQEEYEIKRKLFLDKVYSGNLGCQMANDAHYHPTFGKTPIDQLTLDDYKKPENQFMYTKQVTPQLATENLFIPKDLSKSKEDLSPEELRKMGVNVDDNGNVVPLKRTIGYVSVDDDTGEILSQEEFDVGPGSGAHDVSEKMSDDKLLNFY